MTINATILEIAQTADDINALVCEWVNCTEADVDDQGDIWIAGPMTGHWLKDEKKAEFIDWCRTHA